MLHTDCPPRLKHAFINDGHEFESMTFFIDSKYRSKPKEERHPDWNWNNTVLSWLTSFDCSQQRWIPLVTGDRSLIIITHPNYRS